MRFQIRINNVSEALNVLDVFESDIKIVEKNFLKTEAHSKFLLRSAEVNSYETIKFDITEFDHERF